MAQNIVLTLTNNTTANQNVVLFDTVGAYDSSNAIQDDTLYQWNFTGFFGTYNSAKVIATPSGGSSTTYTYINPSGTINNINDLVDGLNTLNIGTFYALNSTTLAVNGGTSSFSYTSVQMLNTVQFDWSFTNLSLKQIALLNSGTLTGTINWGDGTIDIITGSDTHTYSNAGTYRVTIEYEEDLTTINLTANDITSFNPIVNLPEGLQQLLLSNNNLSLFDANVIILPSTLKILNLGSNSLSSFNIGGLPNGLQQLLLNSNSLTSFNPSTQLSINLQFISLDANQLSVTQINNTLVYLNNIGYSTLAAVLTQNPPSVPSGAGVTAKNALIGRGCTIITD